LLAISVAAGLPVDAPFRLFAIARGVGWAAHAIEQSASGAAIRPRARYQGSATNSLENDRQSVMNNGARTLSPEPL